ncbi:MAG TPA: hypothetical protein VK855_04300 [Thioalkalivibrio sp.]|nr:hypothetical protein [Thioalkalivibrio sp.]
MKEHLFNRKTLAATLGTAAVGLAMGSTPLFAATDLGQGYQVTPSSAVQKVAQGSCGEGKCGGAAAAEKAAEGSCGEGKCGGAAAAEKAAEGSCGEGKCGGAAGEKTTDKSTEGKCGEGRCGS